jgi:hypothetical protein
LAPAEHLETKVKTTLTSLLVSLAVLLPQLAHADIEVMHGEDSSLSIGGMAQLLGFAQHLDDPVTDDNRMFLFLKEGRFRTDGRYGEYRFQLELALGGEAPVVAQTGVSLALLDLSLDLPVHLLGDASLRIGQFKVPYGREALLYSGDSLFVDRSIDHLGFRVGRDVGAALTVHPGPATVIAGLFTGGGRDVPPQHYLPERLGIPLFVLRAGVGNVGEDPYRLSDEPRGEGVRRSAFVNAMFTRDSTVGHSTVLNVKLADKSLLLNSGWNPYIAARPLSQGDWWQVGADGAVSFPMGAARIAAEAELNWAGYSNDAGAVHVAGGRAQAGIGYGPFEAGLRYAVLFPDARFANGGVSLTGSDPIHELTPALSFRFPHYPVKLVADLPVVLQTPVFLEPNVGAYVATELPDEASVVGNGGSVARQNVIEGRLMLQASF